ncbi:MAG TPA: transcription elongation factor GreA [Capsulimonadaceae bacterium]|nr:transcription elongation factor GreA [Capsulimonadaceae bacterium]
MGENEEVVLTPAGFQELNDEYNRLRTVERREVADRIRDAITYGELTENSEYEDAKNAQAFLEGRLEDLRHILQVARVMDDAEIPTDNIGLGSLVTVQEETGDEWEFRMVSPIEADPNRDKISDESPLGESIFGKKVGEEVIVRAPAGTQKYKILSIRK